MLRSGVQVSPSLPFLANTQNPPSMTFIFPTSLILMLRSSCLWLSMATALWASFGRPVLLQAKRSSLPLSNISRQHILRQYLSLDNGWAVGLIPAKRLGVYFTGHTGTSGYFGTGTALTVVTTVKKRLAGIRDHRLPTVLIVLLLR